MNRSVCGNHTFGSASRPSRNRVVRFRDADDSPATSAARSGSSSNCVGAIGVRAGAANTSGKCGMTWPLCIGNSAGSSANQYPHRAPRRTVHDRENQSRALGRRSNRYRRPARQRHHSRKGMSHPFARSANGPSCAVFRITRSDISSTTNRRRSWRIFGPDFASPRGERNNGIADSLDPF